MKIIRWLTFVWGFLALLIMSYYAVQWVLQTDNPLRHEFIIGLGFGLLLGWPAWISLPALVFFDRSKLSHAEMLFVLSPVTLVLFVLVFLGFIGAMGISHVLGAILATAYASVILFIIYCIFFGDESDWPMYWTLGLLLCLPASLPVYLLDYLSYKTKQARWSRVFNLIPSFLLVVVLYIIYGIFFDEHDWMMYWILGLILCFPTSLLVYLLGNLGCKIKLSKQTRWYILLDFNNFIFPFLLIGIGGAVWWFYLPRLLYWLGSSVVALARGI